MPGFFSELKRRRVYQAAAVYVVLAIAGLELADVLVPSTSLPEWTNAFLVVLAIVGFPAVVVLSWVFDVRSGGFEQPAGEARATAQASAPAPEAGDVGAEPPAEAALDPHTVAVLPFANLSGSDDAAPFAAGLHDDLLTELSRASSLTVISRTSVQAYRDTTKSMTEIGRELGAGTIVEGGVQKAGDRVRLNVQLIDASSDAHLWAERYDRKLSAERIFDLQSELTRQIMDRLQATLTPGESTDTSPTADLEAYRQYSLGRAFFVERTRPALESAVRHFQAAVERDPEYAVAWAGLGLSLTMLYDYGHDDSPDLLARGEAAANRALEVDPELPEAHTALGCLYSARREGRRARQAHTRAASLRPGFAWAHKWRCWTSILIGDPETAVEAGIRAVRLDPLDPEGRGNLALAHVGCGDDAAARAVAEVALEDHPAFDWGRWGGALALYHLGEIDRAAAEIERLTEGWATRWPSTTRALEALRGGEDGPAREAVDSLGAEGAWFHAGLLQLALGDREAGLESLERALPMKWDEALYLRYFREWPLGEYRGGQGWAALIEKLDGAWGA